MSKIRFVLHAVPVLVLLLALFGLAADLLGMAPAGVFSPLDLGHAPVRIVLGFWLLEAFGLVALYLLIEGRTGPRWLDGLVAGSVAWIFRGPLLVITVVMAAGRPQSPWWRLAFGWWVLYSVCGVTLAVIARWTAKRSSPAAVSAASPAAGSIDAGDGEL